MKTAISFCTTETDQAVLRQIEQSGNLHNDAGRELSDIHDHHQVGTGTHDQRQTATGGIDRANLGIRAQRCSDRGVKFATRQFGLGLVIVNVIVTDDIVFRCVTGLTGAQDDPRIKKTGFFTDIFNEQKPRILGFHDHINKCHCNIGFGLQQDSGFGS